MSLEPPEEIYSRRPWLWDCAEDYDAGDAHERCVARSKVEHARIVAERDDRCLAAYERARAATRRLASMLDIELVGPEPPRAETCITLNAVAPDGSRLGYLNLVLADNGEAIIHFVYVYRPYRGYGLGRRLVEEAVAYARRLGARRVAATVLWENPLIEVEPERMKRILDSLGFRHIGDSRYVLELRGVTHA